MLHAFLERAVGRLGRLFQTIAARDPRASRGSSNGCRCPRPGRTQATCRDASSAARPIPTRRHHRGTAQNLRRGDVTLIGAAFRLHLVGKTPPATNSAGTSHRPACRDRHGSSVHFLQQSAYRSAISGSKSPMRVTRVLGLLERRTTHHSNTPLLHIPLLLLQHLRQFFLKLQSAIFALEIVSRSNPALPAT